MITICDTYKKVIIMLLPRTNIVESIFTQISKIPQVNSFSFLSDFSQLKIIFFFNNKKNETFVKKKKV